MKSLEASYELNLSKINFLERKVKITHPKTILYGPSNVGKTYLIYDYLSHFKISEYIYIDFNDSRNDYEDIKNNLDKFLRKNQIKVLVLENFDFSFEIPYCDNIIISSDIKKRLKGFKNLTINPLDFEEYILHDQRHQNITISFNNFLKYGNLPEIINLEEHKKVHRLQEIIKLQSKNTTEYEILNILIENIDEKKSLFQLFNALKMKIKVSKDIFYETAKKLQENNTIYFLQKYNQEKAVKKIYCYNHSFLNAITHNKKFKNEFTNMIFLELNSKFKELYYLDNIDFYIKSLNQAVVCIPFFNSILMGSILKKIIKTAKDNEINEVNIITISNNENIKDPNIKINILPFYEWALS